MASLVHKNVKGGKYYQIVTSRRVKGKPRQIVLAHLGTADRLLARLTQAEPKPYKARVHEFGLVAAAFKLARKLELVELIDQHVPKRKQGASVGQYLLLAALNRLAAPTSKAQMAQWYQKTALRHLMPIRLKLLRSQRFWDHMDAVDENAIRQVEAELSKRLVERFGIDLSCLCFDCTNFDTFIDTRNGCELPQRGHAKSKRTDLRVVGLALLVSTDFHIPLFFQVYPGNQPDSVTFASVTEALCERYRLHAREAQHVTLVFDKGNNSKKNLGKVLGGPYHVVGSLVPSQHPDLLSAPLRWFDSFDDPRLEGASAYRTSKEVFGHNCSIVVTRSEALLAGQLRGIAQHLKKRLAALAELREKLRQSQKPGAKGKGYTLESLERHARRLSGGQYIKDILHIEPRQDKGKLTLSYRTDRRALERLERTNLGKRILFTDNHDWTTEDIILAYRSQHHVERAFRDMKNPHCLCWEPMHHWTDQKIRVHAFYCVLALSLGALLHREARMGGVQLSFERIARELSSIKEVFTLHRSPGDEKRGRPRSFVSYTDDTKAARQLASLLDLDPLKLR